MTTRGKGSASAPLIVVGLATILAGCGSGEGKPSPTASNAPVIANLSGSFTGSPGGCQTSGGLGTARLLTFDFVDGDGNVVGGRVLISVAFSPGTTVVDVSFSLPSTGVSITGTTSGTIRVTTCARFGTSAGLTETVTLFDAAGNPSNALFVTTSRPGGAPEVPRSGRGAGYGG